MERTPAGEGREEQGGAYGEGLASRFWLEKAESHVTRSLKRGILAVTEIKSTLPTPEPSQSLGYDEAYLVGLFEEPPRLFQQHVARVGQRDGLVRAFQQLHA